MRAVLALAMLMGCAVDKPTRRPTLPYKAQAIEQLPEGVEAPAGELSLQLGPDSDGWRTYFVVNRTQAPITLTSLVGNLPGVLEARQPDGTFKPVTVWRGSFCGNAYSEIDVLPGQFLQRSVWVMQSGTAGGLRFKPLYRKLPPSPTFAGTYSDTVAGGAPFQPIELRKMPFETLADLITGRLEPDTSPDIRARIRVDALTALKGLDDDPRYPDVLMRIATLPGSKTSGRLAALAMRYACHLRDRSKLGPIFERIATEHDFPGRHRILHGSTLWCAPASLWETILSNPDDPELEAIAKRSARGLRDRYRASRARALQRLVDDERMPSDLRARIKKTLATHGPGNILMQSSLSNGDYAVRVDVRAHSRVWACQEPEAVHHRIDCVDYDVWNASGYVKQHRAPATWVQLGTGPINLKMQTIGLPDYVEPGEYCVEARPRVRIESRPTPTKRGMLKLRSRRDRNGRERRSWSYMSEPCPFAKPAE